MILILTMAGRYQRFADEGFKLPKYLLPWGDQTVLAAILGELQRGRVFSEVFLIANHRDEAYMPHVKAIMRRHDIPMEHLVLTHDTKGQAATALLGVEAVDQTSTQPIVFHNIDTILYNRKLDQLAATLAEVDGYIDVFTSNNSNYSYVLTDDNRRVREIAEKIVVSDLATSGFYGFRSGAQFRELYNPAEDFYISSVYKRMIVAGCPIVTSEKHRESETIVLGTPVEYLNASLVSL
ncbi:MAG: NTP transferase domain-containing protein [Kofleriaceae bacterium]